jgi:arylsulfatase A-like enzyme
VAASSWDTDVPNNWNSSYLDINDLNANRNIEDHREDVERFREVYAATVQYLDHQVAEMVDRLKEVTGNETTIVITADHGENLGYERDHHLVGHKSSLTESLLHVPCLLINPPEGYDEQETEYFSQRRLGELLVSLAHGETPKLFEQRVGAEALGSERYHADGTPVDR